VQKKVRARTQRSRDIKEFVDGYYGRGMSNSKVSRNSRSIVNVIVKTAINSELLYSQEEIERIGHIKGICLNTHGRKHFVGLRDNSLFAQAHERAHVAYSRKKIIAKQKPCILCNELIASSLAFEYLKLMDKADYENSVVRVSSQKLSNLLSFLAKTSLTKSNSSLVGFLLAIAMEKTFSHDEIVQLRQELFNKSFRTFKQLINWYNLKAKHKLGLV
jgi:hypothetical protein